MGDMQTANIDDQTDLLHRLGNDLDGTFPELVGRHQDGLYSGLLRLNRHRQDAEDLAQETFIRAYRALADYDRDRIEALALRGWLWTIALNLTRNRARARSRRAAETALTFDHGDATPGPEDAAMRHSEAAVWNDRLNRLSGPQRTAVVLRHVVGLSYAELATTVNRPVGTVKADVSRGLGRLRTVLEAEGATP